MADRPRIAEKRIAAPVPSALAARIENYRFDQRINSRSEAIRRLIEAGLEAETTPKVSA